MSAKAKGFFLFGISIKEGRGAKPQILIIVLVFPYRNPGLT